MSQDSKFSVQEGMVRRSGGVDWSLPPGVAVAVQLAIDAGADPEATREKVAVALAAEGWPAGFDDEAGTPDDGGNE